MDLEEKQGEVIQLPPGYVGCKVDLNVLETGE